eukprot:6532882-Lingulodinium_polyedra.AAC.1
MPHSPPQDFISPLPRRRRRFLRGVAPPCTKHWSFHSPFWMKHATVGGSAWVARQGARIRDRP